MSRQSEHQELCDDQQHLKKDTSSNLDYFLKNRLQDFMEIRRAISNNSFRTETEKQLLKYGQEASLTILQAKREMQFALQANKLIEQKLKLKDQLFYALSHEIRTPLNGVMGMIDLLMETSLDSKQLDSLKTIKWACDGMFSVCNDALDLSKLDAGKMIQRKIPFHLHEIVQTAIRIFHTRAEEKMIELKLEFDHDLPDLIIGDPYRLNQVLMNLLSNAIKFTLEGRVILKVIRIPSPDKYLSLQFSVTDSGTGIPENRLCNLFEEYSQIKPESEIALQGTGLGLCITKKIIEMMGGHIEVQSRENEGSCFNVLLDFDKVHEPANRQEGMKKRTSERTLEGFRILLAEDNPVNQLFGEKVLQNAGAQVAVAGNGIEVFQKIRNDPFDLILMDLRMPFMDGLQTATLIRKQAEKNLQHIPIIALTATSGSEVINRCMAAGINAYLLKPFSAEVLIDRILSMFPEPLTKKGTPLVSQS
jgi:signal transduction histidine kinase/CheY-like chemotaxis protein